jgi:hypothetical protein
MDELLRRGLDARLADGYPNKYDVLIEPDESPPKPVHVRTVHACPWLCPQFPLCWRLGKTSHGLRSPWPRKSPDCARFFVTKNGDMESELRRCRIGSISDFIDVEAVERYKDN